MTPFTDSDQFYTCARALFTQMEEENPSAADTILASRMVIRLRCTQPDVEFTINGRRRPVQTTFGASNLRPTLDIELPAEALHYILLGQLSVKAALADGRLKVQGPVWKVTALADFFHLLQARYAEILDEHGLPSC